MTRLTVATPLGIERRAVRRGATGDTRVIRTGMGEQRSTRAVGNSELGDSGPLTIAGIGGALTTELRSGDIVVATELRLGGRGVATCPTAPLLATALRRQGLRVHLGPIVSASAPVLSATARQELADTGALAVDMESAWLAPAATGHGRPLAVVRAISDGPDEPLLHPAAARRVLQALRSLRMSVPALEEWAGATGGGEVALASPRSFCAGVERAIEIVERALDRYGAPVYVRRQIVHNAHVVADLEGRGAVFVTELDEVPNGARTILAAHGVSPGVRAEAERRGLSVIDATCPLVAKVHQEVRRYAATDHTVVLIGHADHEEVVGTAGEAPEQVRVVGSEAEAATVEVTDGDRVAFVMQTTLAVDEADRIAAVLQNRFPNMRAPRHDDICYATTNRQQAVREIADDVDLLLVVGSTNSSNSLRLVEVAERAGVAARLIDDTSKIDLRWLVGVRRIGLSAGASAPPHLVEDVVAALQDLGRTSRREHIAVDEDLHFTLPKEVS